jgi:excisionase family DNA binding protein
VIPRYLTAQELADRLSVEVEWLYSKAAAGVIPSVKIEGLRRFREDEVRAWLDSQGETAEVHQLKPVREERHARA